MLQFSYIITYRQIADDRYQHLLRILDWLNTIKSNFEVVIIEQDVMSKLKLIDKYDFDLRHLFFKNVKLFNRSWGFNLGINAANTDVLFFADSDMVVPQKTILECVNLLNTSLDSVKPFNNLIDLNAAQVTELDVTSDINNVQLSKGEHNPLRGGWNYCSGIVAYTKNALIKIHNWDERFEGWGGEDDIQKNKTQLLLKHKVLKSNCYHLYHTRGPNNGTNIHSNYQNNLRLFWKYHRNPRLILNEMIGQDSANPNKYSV